MRRCRAFYLVFAAFGLVLASVTHAQLRPGVQVTVDQSPVRFSGQPPVEQGGRILVPLRGVLERLGAFVRYHPGSRTVSAIRDATNIRLRVGSRRAQVDERTVTLDVPAFIVNGSVLVPLRFVSETLGARVTWNVGTRTVAIDTSTIPSSPNLPQPLLLNARVLAVYVDRIPRRLVVRVRGRNGEPDQERTIPLKEDATISVRQPGKLVAIPLERVEPGDLVDVRQTPEGVATDVEVIPRAAASAPSKPPAPARPAPPADPPKPKPAPEAPQPAKPPQPAARDTLFKGEFLEANRVSRGRWVLKMTDGRLIEVPDRVLVLYGDQKISVDDLRSGDQLTIAVDPKTKRGTRVVVAVEQ